MGNHYRTRLANFKADRPLLSIKDGVHMKLPASLVRALGDDRITSEIVGMMGANVPALTIREADAENWLLRERLREVNDSISEWMEQQGLIPQKVAQV